MEEIESRLEKLKALIEQGRNPYEKRKFETNNKIVEIREKYENIKTGEELKEVKVSIAGRIKAIREHGKLCFADIEDRSSRIQLCFRADLLGEKFSDFLKFIDIGDIIGVHGYVFKTKKGELSIMVENYELLAKCLRPIPKEWFGLRDVEKRFRMRYLDFIMNKQAREIVMLTGKIINAMREFLLARDFIEVETPVLQPIYGGALARPFVTYHNYLDQKMYLRVAPELYLKMLIVAGFERVFEFARCFRNESVDAMHNPEFTQLELYQAYADFNDTMQLIEEMFNYVAKKVIGSETIEYQGQEISFALPWRRISMAEAIKKYGGIDVLKLSEEELYEIAKQHGVEKIERGQWGEIIEKLFDIFVKSNLIQPTFITRFPSDITPLAKRCSDDARFAERYEGYIAGMEVCNGYTELNNPIEQFKRFEEEEELRRKSGRAEIEHEPMNRDFVRALEFGMPPTSGVGVGIARVVCIFANVKSIKEVIPFPAIKYEEVKTLVDLYPWLKKLVK